MTARLHSHLLWRRPIVQKMLECHVVIPPYLPPASVLSATIIVENIVSKPTGILKFNVSWEPPSNLNGNLSFYELCLGQEAVAVEKDNCTSPSTSLCVTVQEEITMANNCAPLELGPSGLPVIDIEYAYNPGCSGVYLQVIK